MLINKEIGRFDIDEINKMLISDPKGTIEKAEAFYDGQLKEIAEIISQDLNRHKVIMLSGPSCSGKTTTALKLEDILKKKGIISYTISLDDFFMDRDKVPLNEKGKPDFESVYTLKIDLLEKTLKSLARGDETWLPKFDFETGKRQDNARKMRLLDNEIAIVEGIHALNDLVLDHIPKENSFKIYIGLRSNYMKNDVLYVAKNELRLLRRTVRDHKFRNHSALKTWDMWSDVRNGERKYIIPFSGRADAVINSAFSYELSEIKPFALPLLEELFDTVHESKAKLLYKALKDLPDIDMELVPKTSLLREFTGGSIFY